MMIQNPLASSSTNQISGPSAPFIRHLTILRFRGIASLSWYPAQGVNVILGGGDVGKTSVLDAIALLLSPSYPTAVPDTDYYGRAVEDEFLIEAVVSLPQPGAINYTLKPSWPWSWNGVEAIVPTMDDEVEAGEPVYRLRVRGTTALDLEYEVVQPDDSVDIFTVTLRRAIGLVRLSGDDRNDRDLRLVQGSALDRLLADRSYRSKLASKLANNEVTEPLTDEAKEILKNLDVAFHERKLPTNLDLAITGSEGRSITSFVGLAADRNTPPHGDIQLPLATWGAGTRRIASLAIAEQRQGDAPVTIVDEIERGLEPYRQRSLLEKLQSGKSQVFVTTHSLSAISAASKSAIWYIDHQGRIGALEARKIEAHRQSDPETFLSRLTIVAEGATEIGFVTVILERALSARLAQYGIHVSDGGGHETTLDLLEALASGGLQFGGFADDEGLHPTRWKVVEDILDKLLFRWVAGCVEENIINALSDEQLEDLIIDPSGAKTGERYRSLAERIGSHEKDFQTIKAKSGLGFRALILGAAKGTVPEGRESEKKHYQRQGQLWFKSVSGGRELAEKMFSFGVWPVFKPQLMQFCNSVRNALELDPIEDLEECE